MTTIIPVRPRRWLRVAALFAAGALMLGACATEADPDEARRGAAGGTATDTTAKNGAKASDDLRATLEGAIERTRAVHSAELSISIEVGGFGQVQRAGLEGELNRDDVGSIATQQDGGILAIELRSDGETAWMRIESEQLEGQMPEGVRWVEAPIRDLREAGIFTGLDESFALLDVLRGVDEARDAGTDEINGDTIRLIEATIDWDAALSAASPDERAGLEESITVDENTAIKEFHATIGLDDEDRVRRLQLDIAAGPAGTEPGMPGMELGMHIGFEAVRYDHEVTVPDAPPADETVSLDEVPGLAAMFG